jgi:alpha-glucosidase
MSVLEQASPEWLAGVIYQIYLRSFRDSNGDGVGDLAGVTEKLDYLQWLGVTGVWLTPFYPSPLLDSGYDAADFTDVHPTFGTLEDFDHLVSAAHQRDLKVIVDFVPNHTSDQHPWFQNSRSSRQSSHRGWYLWHDPAPDGGPPNNWLSEYGESAWQWDETTGQYYQHSFLKEQPDLNWRNGEMRDAVWSALRFWLNRGIDGVRIDALPWLIKDEHWRNHPPNPDYHEGLPPRDKLVPVFSQDQPGVEQVIQEMRAIVNQYPDRVMLGEIRLPVERYPSYYRAGLHFPFNYQLTGADQNPLIIRRMIDRYEGLLGPGQWPNWFLGTHDESRVITRLGEARARTAAMLALTLRGTGVVYYGEEIGMHDVPIPPERITDSYARLLPQFKLGRDPQRTPMQWSSDMNGGFTSGEPWLPVADDYARTNVEALRDDPTSILTLYRRLIALRRHEAFRSGHYVPDAITSDGLAFRRESEERRFLVALNYADHEIRLSSSVAVGRIELSTALDRDNERVERQIALRANEGLVIQLD